MRYINFFEKNKKYFFGLSIRLTDLMLKYGHTQGEGVRV